jgi:hypothetical protein
MTDGQLTSVLVSGSRFVLSDNCGFLDVGRPLCWEHVSVIYSYNCFWALPEQSLLGPSPAVLRPYFALSYETRGPWPEFNFLSLTFTFFLLHVGRPLWLEDGSVICSAITHLSRTGPIIIYSYYCLVWDSPNLEGQVPLFISPRNKVG